MVRPRSERPTRRAVLLSSLVLSACGSASIVDAGAPPTGDGWKTTPFPSELESVGAAVVELPEALINLWIIRLDDGTFTAAWRVCTHGACDVEPVKNEGFVCPCHGARFSIDGTVLTGPATRPLRRFEAVRFENTLYLRRA